MPWSKYGEVFGSSPVPKETFQNAKKISNYANNLLLFIDQYIVAIRKKVSTRRNDKQLVST